MENINTILMSENFMIWLFMTMAYFMIEFLSEKLMRTYPENKLLIYISNIFSLVGIGLFIYLFVILWAMISY